LIKSKPYPTLKREHKVKVFINGPGQMDYRLLFAESGYFRGADDIEDAEIVCFTGGSDVSPELYNQDAHPTTRADVMRDMVDTEVFEVSKQRGLFQVGICRGAQFLNVMNGGSMWQHVNGHTMDHHMYDQISGRSLLVSSTHHQMMIPTSDGAVLMWAGVAERKEDATRTWTKGNEIGKRDDPEVVWYEDTRCLCFQPHPEFSQEKYRPMREYFIDTLIEKYWETYQ